MKYQRKYYTVCIILSLLITSNVAASVLIDDSKIFKNSNYQRMEKEEPINETVNSTENITTTNTTTDDDNDSSNNTTENATETITVYCYPSSWQDNNYPYRLYKTVWSSKILDICELNPKGTYEKEWTKYSDDSDYSCLTGLEKEYHGFSVSEYLISVEVV